MFSFRSKEEPALQLYGKLPLAKDYLRIGCGEGAGRRLRDWMDRGFSSAVEGSAAPSLSGPLGFLWSDGSGTALLGILWPSSDAGGLRPFPFVLFVERKWRALWSELEQSLEQPERWLGELEACQRGLGGFGDGAALLSGLRGKKITPATALGANSVGLEIDPVGWLASLWPTVGQAGLEAQLGNLLHRAGESSREPLQLPLSSDLPLAPQVHAWWSVLVESGLALKSGGMALFFPRPGNSHSWMTLFPREPDASQAGWLMRAPAGASPDQGVLHPAAPIPFEPTLAKTLCRTLARVRARIPASG